MDMNLEGKTVAVLGLRAALVLRLPPNLRVSGPVFTGLTVLRIRNTRFRVNPLFLAM